MSQSDQKSWWILEIVSRSDSLTVAKRAGIAFWILASIQALVGAFLMPAALADAVVTAALATVLFVWRSRVAAVGLLMLSLWSLVLTALNLIRGTAGGGRNIVFSAVFLWAAVRAVEATFKLHGRFKGGR